jgi:hypothetical protein
VLTRFESAPRAAQAGKKHLSVGSASSQRSDDSIRVSTFCLPKPSSRPKTCPSDRHQAHEVMTRFASALLAFSSRPQSLSVRPTSNEVNDDSIRVGTSCLPKPANNCQTDRRQANEVMTRLERAPLTCPGRQKTFPSVRRHSNEVMNPFASAPLVRPNRQKTSPSDRRQAKEVLH